MPYSLPTHHRSPSLPRRRHATPVFHFNNDNESESSDSDSAHSPPTLPVLKLKSRPSSFHGAAVPFPAPPPPVQRTNSSPILLSNGKPLKSSLKSSPSSPTIPSSSSAPGPPGRTRAASTPALDNHVPKNVHFPSNHLATVRFYSRSARPASLSLAPDGADTETETETERPQPQPFPPPPPLIHTLDTAASSPVPAPSPAPHANVHLESLTLHRTDHAPTSLALRGTLLVRNLAYEKTVAVRFTLDDWNTTSEVLAHYTASLPALPSALYVPGSGLLLDLAPGPHTHTHARTQNPAWDRFAFTIRLDDYAPSLATRTLWLVVRYCTSAASSGPSPSSSPAEGIDDGECEWWDNNGGRNYRVAFRLSEDAQPTAPRTHVPAPPPPPPPIALRTHTPSSPTRLRALSLSNYAAPVPPSPTSPSPSSLSPSLSPHPHPHDPALPTSTDSSPALQTPIDLAGAPGGMEILHGFPATVGFGGLGLDLGMEGTPHPHARGEPEPKANANPKAVSLYWPWAHTESHHRRMVSPPPPPPVREPSPPLSDSSSSSSSSSSSGESEAGRGDRGGRRPGPRPRVGRRVFGPVGGVPFMSSSSSSSASVSAPHAHPPTQNENPTQNQNNNETQTQTQTQKDDDQEKEQQQQQLLYQALVRKWCFAAPPAVGTGTAGTAGPQHAQGHGHGHGQGRRGGMGVGVVH